MNNTVLSSHGYGILKAGNDALVEQLRRELTVTPKTNPSMPSAAAAPFPVWRENSTRLYVPRVFGLERFGAPTQRRLQDGLPCAADFTFNGALRTEQEAPVAAFEAAARDPLRGGGLLILPCAFGKTALSLYLACAFRRKTLVICHKEFLMNQWRERIAAFVPNARVGLIKGKHADTTDKDIVLATLQSVAMKSYPDAMFAEFGFVIIDETHHIAAEVFSRALPKITAPIMLGLTATPNRKDGLRKVFEWFLGRPVYEVKRRAENQLTVRMITYGEDESPDAEYRKERLMYNGRPNNALMVNQICGHEPRTDFIVGLISQTLADEPERKILVLSDRRAHLDALDRKVRTACPTHTTGFYVGGMKQEALDASATRDIIFATTNMAAEGLDIPALNTLVLASPISALEQPIGRIQRQKPHERTHVPLVIDIWDKFSIFLSQGYRRIQFYKKNGYCMGSRAEQEDDGNSDISAYEPAPPRKMRMLEDDDDE